MEAKKADELVRTIIVAGQYMKQLYEADAAVMIEMCNECKVPTVLVPLKDNDPGKTPIWRAAKKMGFDIGQADDDDDTFTTVYGTFGNKVTLVSYIKKTGGN